MQGYKATIHRREQKPKHAFQNKSYEFCPNETGSVVQTKQPYLIQFLKHNRN